jgi:glyoxylase-like metal-dependent hydrolase (beta-lactamase superfamily II)
MPASKEVAVQPVTIGNVEILPVLDTAALMNPRVFLPAVGEQVIAEYPHLLDERQLLAISITTYLLRSDGRTYLVDTGVGPRRRAGLPRGHLNEALAEAGVDPAEVETIIHTHLHVDHVGWNTVDDDQGESRLFFPQASYLVQQVEWDHWMQPRFVDDPENAHLRECVRPLEGTGRIRFMKGEEAIDQNLTFISTPGHTPGHVAIGIYSAGERAILIGDASHHPFQLDHPDWSPGADTDPVQSATTRDRLFDAAAADGRTWIAGHWPFPGVGRIIRLNGRRVFQAL